MRISHRSIYRRGSVVYFQQEIYVLTNGYFRVDDDFAECVFPSVGNEAIVAQAKVSRD